MELPSYSEKLQGDLKGWFQFWRNESVDDGVAPEILEAVDITNYENLLEEDKKVVDLVAIAREDQKAQEEYSVEKGKRIGMQKGMLLGREEGREEGEQIGMQEGQRKNAIKTALSMLSDHMPIELIQRYT
jgi:predicted transposase YdaD